MPSASGPAGSSPAKAPHTPQTPDSRSTFDDVPKATLHCIVNPLELVFDRINWLRIYEFVVDVIDDLSMAAALARANYAPPKRRTSVAPSPASANAPPDDPIALRVELRLPVFILPPQSGHTGPPRVADIVLRISASKVVIFNEFGSTSGSLMPPWSFYHRRLFAQVVDGEGGDRARGTTRSLRCAMVNGLCVYPCAISVWSTVSSSVFGI